MRERFVLFALLTACLLVVPGVGAQQVTGRVVDQQTSQPIAAVQVFIPGAGIGALSQQNGRYLLLNVPAGTHTITAQRIGYRIQTAEITVAAGATVVRDFALSEEALGLDEIIVTGTPGGTQRRAIGNAVTVVRRERMSPRSLRCPVCRTLLTGRSPGLQFTRSDRTDLGTGSALSSIRGVCEPLVALGPADLCGRHTGQQQTPTAGPGLGQGTRSWLQDARGGQRSQRLQPPGHREHRDHQGTGGRHAVRDRGLGGRDPDHHEEGCERVPPNSTFRCAKGSTTYATRREESATGGPAGTALSLRATRARASSRTTRTTRRTRLVQSKGVAFPWPHQEPVSKRV